MNCTQCRRSWLLIMGSILVCLLFIPTSAVKAQPAGYTGIEVTPMFGYMFGGKLRGYEGELVLSDEFTYGVRLSKALQPGTTLELSWNSMKSDAVLRGFYGSESARFDMAVNYILIGATQDWQSGSDDVIPYGLLGLGTAIFSASGNESLASGDEWFFAAELGMGVKVFLSDRIGLRFQGRFLLPMIFGGGSLWCGSNGCGTGVYTTSAILQGDLSGGLIFRF